jgi:hypothetical protein
VHFGLGQSTRIDNLELSWPGGRKEKVSVPAPDCIYVIEQGRGIVGQLCRKGAGNPPASGE